MYILHKSDKTVTDALSNKDDSKNLLYNSAFKNIFPESEVDVYEIEGNNKPSEIYIIPSIVMNTIYVDMKGKLSIEDIEDLTFTEDDLLNIDFSRFSVDKYMFIGNVDEDYHIERYARSIDIFENDNPLMIALKTVMSETVQIIQDDDHRDKIRHLYSKISRESSSPEDKMSKKGFLKKLELIKYFSEKVEIKVSYRGQDGKLIHKSFEI